MIHIVEYYKIPHPLKRDEKIVVTDPDKIKEKLSTMQKIRQSNLPLRFFRVLLSPETILEPEKEETLVKKYEYHFSRKEGERYNFLKLREFLHLSKSLCFAYFLYVMPASWWFPVVYLVNAVMGRGLDNWAKMFIIAYFPIKALIGSFGTGVVIPLPRFLSRIPLVGGPSYLGAKGRWNELNQRAKNIQLVDRWGKSLKEKLRKDIQKVLSNIEEKIRDEKNSGHRKYSEKIQELTREILDKEEVIPDFARDWSERFDLLLEELTRESERGSFPWAEIPKLTDLKEDLIFHYFNHFKLAPLKIINPHTPLNKVFLLKEPFSEKIEDKIDLDMEIKAQLLRKKAEILRVFLKNTWFIQERIYQNYQALTESSSRRERISLLDEIAADFEKLRNIAATLYRENSGYSYERECALANVYHQLYLEFGKTSCDLENGYKMTALGKRAIKTDKQERKRIEELNYQVERFLCQKTQSRRLYHKLFHLLGKLGKNWQRGIITTLGLLFIWASFLSFYTLKPGQVAIETRYIYGAKEEITQRYRLWVEKTRIKEFGQGLRILPGVEVFWHWPAPLMKVRKIDLNQPQSFSVYTIIGEHFPRSLLEQVKGRLGGEFLGKSYQLIRFDFSFTPRNKEWAYYDIDALGGKRLMRDVGIVVENWKAELLAKEDWIKTEEMDYIFGPYFKQLCQRGIIKRYIGRLISGAPHERFFYGSPLERIKPGIDVVRAEFEEKLREVEGDPEKEELKRSLNWAKEFVERTFEEIKEEVETEFGYLRKRPQKLKRYIQDPLAYLPELRGFEGLWGSIQYYTLSLYSNQKLAKMLKGELGEEEKTMLVADLLRKIKEDEHISSLIEIREVHPQIIYLDYTEYATMMQELEDII